MHHFFATSENIGSEYIHIHGEDVNHMKNVLRLKTDDEILISSGDNTDYYCRIEKIDEEEIVARIEKVDEEGRELSSRIYLFQGLPKSDKLELIIQKAVELGVYEIIPVAMKRSIVKLDRKKEESKLKRWNNIAESAAKQSKRSVIPKVREVLSFSAALQMAKELDTILLPYECAEGIIKTKELISSLEPGKSIGIFIGPEGGFELDELEKSKEAGAKIITLGKRILRTETAGLMILSVLMFELEGK